MSEKGNPNKPKKVKLSHRDVPKEWQKAVKDRAKAIKKDEDWIIRHGLYAEPELEEDVISLLEQIRDELKKGKK